MSRTGNTRGAGNQESQQIMAMARMIMLRMPIAVEAVTSAAAARIVVVMVGVVPVITVAAVAIIAVVEGEIKTIAISRP